MGAPAASAEDGCRKEMLMQVAGKKQEGRGREEVGGHVEEVSLAESPL